MLQAKQRIAMGWKVRGSNSDGGEIFRARPESPRGSHSFLYNRHRVFPGIKRPERDDPPF